MRKYTYNGTVKIAAAIILTITLGASIVMGLASTVLSEYGLFSLGKEAFKENLTKDVIYEMLDREWYTNYQYEIDNKDYNWYENDILNSKYFDGIDLVIKNDDDETVYTTYDSNTTYKTSYNTGLGSYEGKSYSVAVYVREDLPKGCALANYDRYADAVYRCRSLLPIGSILNMLVAVISFIYLMVAAGRREGEEEIHVRRIDKGYADVYFVAIGTAIVGLCGMTYWGIKINVATGIIVGSISFIIASLIMIAWCMSASVQIKNMTFVRNSLTGRVCSLFWRIIKQSGEIIRKIASNIPYTWKKIATTLIIIAINLVAVVSGSIGIIILESIVIILYVAYNATNIKLLDDAAEKLANGRVGQKINLKHMFGAAKRRGESLNLIDDAVANAVEEQMKSERMKAELITNVSHDIKTPLTSIINYTSLLMQHLEESDDETAKEYLAIIDKNSQRLKKLTSDIVEVSKASTGAVEIELANIDFGMLVEQSLSEYTIKLEEAKVVPVVKIEEGITINADGKLMWRVVDNILSNICKYTMPGTRVYISVNRSEDKAVALFKNISSAELNISKEELMERFVRGDESRNTEGSGLGLSIAENLAKLQGGRLDVDIDGDLFKSRLEFDVVV